MRLIDADALIKTIIQMPPTGDVFDRIHDAQTIELPHWIPCSERLPEHNQICIVTDDTRIGTYEYGFHKETYDKENGWTYLGHKIIAWMPLPEPYGGERDETGNTSEGA